MMDIVTTTYYEHSSTFVSIKKEGHNMFRWILKIIAWIKGLWEKIPDEVKEKIIDTIIEVFGNFFKDYYKKKKEEEEEEKKKNEKKEEKNV